MNVINLLDLLEATGDDEDQRLANRLRSALKKVEPTTRVQSAGRVQGDTYGDEY